MAGKQQIMKKFSEQLNKQAEKVKLSAFERDDLRERIGSYMEYHPLPESRRNQPVFAPKQKSVPTPIWQNSWMMGRVVGSMAVLILVMVPALAENALPGDTLYPIKVRFNEGIRGALSDSPYEKVEWETERLERRLAEAQLLAESGRLTPDVEAGVVEAIKVHSDAAKASIESIRESDTEDATLAEMSLSTTLEVSAEVWTNIDSENGAPSSLSGAVSAARDGLDTSKDQVSYSKVLSKVESETTRAYEYLSSLNQVSEGERSDIRRRLTDVQTKIDVAAKVKKEDEEKAIALLTESLSSTRKIISFITNLDVRRNVSIEKLVPLTKTEAEKAEAAQKIIDEAEVKVSVVEAALQKVPVASNDHVAITASLNQYKDVVSAAKESLEEGSVVEATEKANEALELAEALHATMSGLGFLESETTASSTVSSTVGT